MFTYEATDSKGKIVTGEITAVTEKEAMHYLGRQGLIPIVLTNKSEKGGSDSDESFSFFDSINSVDRLFLIRNLSTMLKAGLSFNEAIDILAQDTDRPPLRKFLLKVQRNLQNGLPLSFTLDQYRVSFPPVFIGMVKAGEASGKLADSLTDLNQYLSREYALAAKVKGAMVYPVILMFAAVLVITLLLVFVLPKLTESFASSGTELPGLTKFFLTISNVLTISPLLDFGVIFGSIIGFITLRRTEKGRVLLSTFASKIPGIRDVVKKVALIRFARVFGTLLASGVSAIESLELTGDAVGSKMYKNSLLDVTEQIKNGTQFSVAIGKYPKLFPLLLVNLIMVGERTGTLEHILRTYGDFMDEEVDGTLKRVTSAIEPILLMVMGIVVGSIAVAIMLPIFKLVGSFT